MGFIAKSAVVAFLMAFFCALASCAERASEGDITQMCQRLVQLHPELTTKTDQDQQLASCRTDAEREKPFKSVADCRTKADSLDMYWNRCR